MTISPRKPYSVNDHIRIIFSSMLASPSKKDKKPGSCVETQNRTSVSCRHFRQSCYFLNKLILCYYELSK